MQKKKRNPLKNEIVFGDFITSEALETEPKKTGYPKAKVKQRDDDGIVESNPFNLTTKDTDAAIIGFLKKVKNFQDRAWKRNPVKAKSKRRLVYGIREVRKQLTLEAVRCVVLARDIETDKSTELADEIDIIKEICACNRIEVFWISSKHDLGKAVKKWPIVSVVAILDYCGAEDAYNAALQTCANFMACCRIVEHIDQSSLFP
uniref:Ribosomal protein L7Ae/L30e/S12e/Gadd45 domain-containing protein n=1 Tax=Setaria digitata TaxID=48799 RepID=A0A915Q412_9BILA